MGLLSSSWLLFMVQGAEGTGWPAAERRRGGAAAHLRNVGMRSLMCASMIIALCVRSAAGAAQARISRGAIWSAAARCDAQITAVQGK